MVSLLESAGCDYDNDIKPKCDELINEGVNLDLGFECDDEISISNCSTAESQYEVSFAYPNQVEIPINLSNNTFKKFQELQFPLTTKILKLTKTCENIIQVVFLVKDNVEIIRELLNHNEDLFQTLKFMDHGVTFFYCENKYLVFLKKDKTRVNDITYQLDEVDFIDAVFPILKNLLNKPFSIDIIDNGYSVFAYDDIQECIMNHIGLCDIDVNYVIPLVHKRRIFNNKLKLNMFALKSYDNEFKIEMNDMSYVSDSTSPF